MKPETRELRLRYAEMNNFVNQLKASKTLTFRQKSTLWGQARSGDLDGALKGYRKLVDVRRDD